MDTDTDTQTHTPVSLPVEEDPGGADGAPQGVH